MLEVSDPLCELMLKALVHEGTLTSARAVEDAICFLSSFVQLG